MFSPWQLSRLQSTGQEPKRTASRFSGVFAVLASAFRIGQLRVDTVVRCPNSCRLGGLPTVCVMLRALFSTIVASSMVPTLVGIPLRGSEEHTAKATARVVASIFEYTRWPGPTDPVRLCVVGPAEHADAMGRFFLSDGREVVRASLASDGPLRIENCDALYLGRMPLDQGRRWTSAARGGAIVTISESDAECRSEAMFCLLFEPGSLSFRLNIDAVSRSRVRIDPRVLRIARTQSAQ